MTQHVTIGIDFGLTKISAATWDTTCNTPKLIKLGNHLGAVGSAVEPSYVGFNDLETVIGYEAMAQMTSHSNNTFFDIKRFVSKQLDGPSPELQYNFVRWAFQKAVDEEIEPETGTAKLVFNITFRGRHKQLTAEILVGCLFNGFKKRAEACLGCPVSTVVVSVPASFNHYQKNIIAEGSRLAGLKMIQILSDIQAALYTLEFIRVKNIIPPQVTRAQETVLLADFGGGDFDIALATLSIDAIDIEFSRSLTGVGGVDFANKVYDHLLQNLPVAKRWKVVRDPSAMAQFRRESERIVVALSSRTLTPVLIPNGLHDTYMDLQLSRNDFENICSDLFDVIRTFIEDTVEQVSPNVIHQVLLCGKCTNIPKTQELFKAACGPNIILNTSLDPDTAVSFGAAIWAATQQEQGFLNGIRMIHTVLHFSLGIEIEDGLFAPIINGNSTVKLPFPIKNKLSFTSKLNSENGITINVFEGNEICVQDNFLLKSLIFVCPGEEYLSNDNFSVPSSEVNNNYDELESNITVTMTLHQNQTLELTVDSARLHLRGKAIISDINSSSSGAVTIPSATVLELMMSQDDIQTRQARDHLHQYIQDIRSWTKPLSQILIQELESTSNWLNHHGQVLLNISKYKEMLKHLRLIANSNKVDEDVDSNLT